MLNTSRALLAAAAITGAAVGTAAHAAQEVSADPAAITSGETLQYRQGAFYYGSDCGGNSAMAARGAAKSVPPGLILDGETGARIRGDMNCDDRRQAMSVYRDGLEGRLGQQYDWRNSVGGGNGSMTPVRQYTRGAFSCRDFREKTLVGMELVSRNGSACRQSDGNWHTL